MMIDQQIAPTERKIPNLTSAPSELLEYAQIALISGNDEHRRQVAKLISDWMEANHGY